MGLVAHGSQLGKESGHEGHRPVQPMARLLHGAINLSTCGV
jgi:hypothetical protein